MKCLLVLVTVAAFASAADAIGVNIQNDAAQITMGAKSDVTLTRTAAKELTVVANVKVSGSLDASSITVGGKSITAGLGCGLGRCAANPARSCREIQRTFGNAAKTGNYYIKDIGATSETQVSYSLCDMDTDGGGWQRVLDSSLADNRKLKNWKDAIRTTIGRDLRKAAITGKGKVPTYAWTQEQVYGHGLLNTAAGSATEFMITTNWDGQTKSKAKGIVGDVTAGWFEDNSFMCWDMFRLEDANGEIRAQHRFGNKPTFQALIGHGQTKGPMCGSKSQGGASWDGYWTLTGGAFYSEFSFFDSGVAGNYQYPRIFNSDMAGPTRGLAIWLRPRFHPSPASILGSDIAAFEDTVTDGGGWFRVLKQTLTKKGSSWVRTSYGRNRVSRRVDVGEKPPPYAWVQEQVFGGGKAEALFGYQTEFMLKSFYNGNQKGVSKGVLHGVASGWFGGDDECWTMTKLEDANGPIRANGVSSIAPNKATYNIQMSNGRETGSRCECDQAGKFHYCGTSINSLWVTTGGSGKDFYMEYTLFDDTASKEGDHFRRIYDGNNDGTAPRGIELWLRPPFYPDPRSIAGLAPPHARVDMSIDGGGWLSVFRQFIYKKGSDWVRVSYGMTEDTKRVDKGDRAPPYKWVQKQVFGNGVIAGKYGSDTEFMIKTYRAGIETSASKSRIRDVTSGWFEDSTMCLQMTLLENSVGPIRNKETRTFRTLKLAGLEFGAQISLGAGVGGTVCKCNANTDKYCGKSTNSYWVFGSTTADSFAEYTFFEKGGVKPVYRRIGNTNQKDEITRGIEILIRPAL